MEVVIRKTKKILKAIGWTILVAILMLVGFHIWFIHNSEKTLERLIAWRSNGKLRAKIKKFSIDYFNNNAEIKELTIFNADTVSRGTAYQFTTKELHFNVRSKWDLIFHKKLLVDSLVFSSPDIIITRKAQRDSAFKKLPLAEELGNVYNAINNSLTVLNLERFEMNEGRVAVKDAGTNGKTRFELKHIFLSIDHLKIDSSNKNKHSFAFSDRVVLRILKQKVKLPDDSSSISFNQILIDSKLGVIEITKPQIKIYPAAGFKNNFDASAKQLNITGLDFNALYVQPIIKIDSVFMQDPVGDLQLYRKDKNVKNKKQMPLNDALRHLPVALSINHVVVQNGTVAVALHQDKKTTVFDTKNDNLSVVGISINDTASKVLNIDGFNYIIKKYVGYTPDSIYRYRFDSLQFIDNKIILYNFNIATFKKVQSILIRNYNVPKFEITDMDWPSFIFNNHFSARKAVLYNAVFNIEKNSDLNIKNNAQKVNKKSIYQTLSVMDDLFDLDELKVVNGEFNAKQGEDLKLHIGNLNWDINANELTQATTFKGLVHSVKELSFDTATATNAALTLHVSKSNFNDRDKKILFEHLLLNTSNESITASLDHVSVGDFSFDNKELDVNEIHWSNGNIHIDSRNMTGKKVKTINRKNYAFTLNKISGENSTLSFENDDLNANVNVKQLTAASLFKTTDSILQFKGLFVNGENAQANWSNAKLVCKEMIIRDQYQSILSDVSFIRKTQTDTAIVRLPMASFIPNINKTIATNAVVLDSVDLIQPQLYLTAIGNDNNEKLESVIKPLRLPAINVNGVHIDRASLYFSFAKDFNKSIIQSKEISLRLQCISTQDDNAVLFNKIHFYSTGISVKQNKESEFTSNGNINLLANNFLFNPATRDWKFDLNEMTADNFNYSNQEDNKFLYVDKIKIQNIITNSKNFNEGLPWFINQSSAYVALSSMHWQTPNTNLALNNFIFNGNERQVSIDSISIDPGKNKQEFEGNLVYRKAFLTAKTGKVLIDGLNYEDSLIHVRRIITNNPFLDIYSDNLKKSKAQMIRALPIVAIKKISLPLQIDTLQLKDMVVNYTEINALTKKTGTVNFNAINGNVLNINTKPAQSTDSLRLNVTANFMDKLPVHFNMQSSYTDSLNGFALQLQVGGGDAKILNPVLEPFVLLRVKTGFIDTMRMEAIANEYAAHGTMRLYYHGLNAELLDSSALAHRRFKIRFFSFLANSFAIRNNNYKRITTFNLDRVRTKSAISYLLKMVVEGAAGNVMPQASKILIKKQLKKQAKTEAATGAVNK